MKLSLYRIVFSPIQLNIFETLIYSSRRCTNSVSETRIRYDVAREIAIAIRTSSDQTTDYSYTTPTETNPSLCARSYHEWLYLTSCQIYRPATVTRSPRLFRRNLYYSSAPIKVWFSTFIIGHLLLIDFAFQFRVKYK